VRVGRIGRAHGVRGELTLDGSSLTASELEAIGRFTWRGRDGATAELEIASVRPADQRLLVGFSGIEDRDRAAELSNGELWVDAECLPDPGPDTAYTFQLIGLEVRTVEGRSLGTLADVIATGAHPVYVVQGKRELLVPANPEVVRHVDLAAGVITVELPRGLEEL
jgi:16S rRNA processing protein RimM